MSERRSQDSEDAREWFRFAADDLGVAQHTIGSMEPCPYHLVAYHAQQCGEKVLKAFLIWRNVPYPLTHDVRLLLDRCAELDGASWIEQHRDAVRLIPLAVLGRYPSEVRTVSASEAEDAVAIARRLLDATLAVVKSEGLEL